MENNQSKSNLIPIALISVPVLLVAVTWLLSFFPALQMRGAGSTKAISVEIYVLVFLLGVAASVYVLRYLVKTFKCPACDGLFYAGAYSNIRNKSCACCNKQQ